MFIWKKCSCKTLYVPKFYWECTSAYICKNTYSWVYKLALQRSRECMRVWVCICDAKTNTIRPLPSYPFHLVFATHFCHMLSRPLFLISSLPFSAPSAYFFFFLFFFFFSPQPSPHLLPPTLHYLLTTLHLQSIIGISLLATHHPSNTYSQPPTPPSCLTRLRIREHTHTRTSILLFSIEVLDTGNEKDFRMPTNFLGALSFTHTHTHAHTYTYIYI